VVKFLTGRRYCMPVTEKRMSRLERALENFITSVRDSQMRTESELREFKEEMRVFKDEMRDYKEENKQQLREMNIKWGEMARKLGTITEDLVAPSIPRIIKEEYGLEVTDLMVRRKKRLMDGRSKEYDAIAVAGEYVFVDETKSTLDSEDVKDFIEDIQGFRDFFPEYEKNKVVGILAGLYVDEGVIKYAEKAGFLVLAIGDALMEIKNTKGFKPKEW
jgi:seryl-tRNA(Sec) selenium transferase